ncbi:hypothetical protein [Sphingobium sp. B12D2B]|uniref:hypothetical protein n=1 Tax=Sphingobium sp. B12D2B TaxID=2940577 RepID=UPI00222467BC|nr:hypothetical protein [Sphingobium sp. B12D2B]MCW2349162.1 hypothetical protein [Sphingobium sp. B12D2B]
MLAHALELDDAAGNGETATASITLLLPIVRVRRGHQLRLVIPGPTSLSVQQAQRDPKLLALLAEAMAARKIVLANPDKSLNALGAEHGRCRTRLGRLAAISCLAPDLVTAVVEGKQPPRLTAKALLDNELPSDWQAQRVVLGIA